MVNSGVNTGFGGSADTRTGRVEELQCSLISFLNCGILTLPLAEDEMRPDYARSSFASALPNEDPVASTFMPEPWVRAALTVRTNSLISGNSGVRPELIESLTGLLQNNITPVIPLRGSISASGDLIPLSYIAGAIQGNPAIKVWTWERCPGFKHRVLLPSDVALSNSSFSSLKLGPKEGLAIVNGTSVSTGVGALALHDAHCLLVLSQILTSMGVEALRGSTESFDPFLGKIRPHKGQLEVAHNIKGFLAGSRLAISTDPGGVDDGSLRQDRYAIRTSSQWIGPQLEDLMLAHNQIIVECNSTTDNPVIDTAERRVFNGGNFQAMSVTSAMEKIRPSLQIIGRMLFAQCTELINPSLNNGLPPNLDADEPSQSFLMKGVDIEIAALQAELGFLANPVASHVQTAEMGNQSLNSLALLSARYTHTALDTLSQLVAAYLFVLCQALDLRVLQMCFLESLNPAFETATREILAPIMGNVDSLHVQLWLHLQRELDRTTSMDSARRFSYVMECLQPMVLSFASPSAQNDAGLVPALHQWSTTCTELLLRLFQTTYDAYLIRPDPKNFLGSASSRMYRFVRQELKVPFQNGTVPKKSTQDCEERMEVPLQNGRVPKGPTQDCEELVEIPFQNGTVPKEPTQDCEKQVEVPFQNCTVPNEPTPDCEEDLGSDKVATTGSYISRIYVALRNGELYVPAMDCLREVLAETQGAKSWSSGYFEGPQPI